LNHAMRRQFLVYVGIGILSAIVDIGCMQALLLAGWHHGVAVTAGFAVGLVFNYFCHQRITFKAMHTTGAVLRFSLLVLMNYVLTLGCVQLSLLLVDSVLAGKLASLPLVAVNGFLWGRYWIFRRQEGSE